MKLFSLIAFISSLSILALVLFRKKQYFRWLSYAVMNVVLAALVLYLINLSGVFNDFYIPINLATVLTVGILGIPGLLLLIAIQLTLF
jgi:inhibitor of the pro-sigma K processing machinery